MKRKIFCQLTPSPTTIFLPKEDRKSPFLVDLPHGGSTYPSDFHFSCPAKALELCEEKYLDDLFTPPVTGKGGTVLKANFPRTYVDVNRSMNDIDQLLLDTPWTEPVCDKGRSVHGHGVIMRLVHGNPIYTALLSPLEVKRRLENYYSKYHETLSHLSNHIYAEFGVVYHLNIHSMPSSVAKAHFPHTTPDFILGDLDGRSCRFEFRSHVSETLKDMGYHVAINQLYKGAEIVSRYGQPAWGRHSLQIEINRAVFQDESSGDKNKNFETLKKDIENLIDKISVLK